MTKIGLLTAITRDTCSTHVSNGRPAPCSRNAIEKRKPQGLRRPFPLDGIRASQAEIYGNSTSSWHQRLRRHTA